MRTAVDTNILSALWGAEQCMERAAEMLWQAEMHGALVISGVVYVELRAHPASTETFIDRFLRQTRISVEWELPREVWQMAADRFGQYAERRRVQKADTPKRLPADFLVAAHALLRADRLMTLDRRRYQTDFPELNLTTI
jgi:hypothetical protein